MELEKHWVKALYPDGSEQWTQVLLTAEQAKKLISKGKDTLV